MSHVTLQISRWSLYNIQSRILPDQSSLFYSFFLYCSRTSKLHDRKWNHNFTLLNHLSFTLVLYVNYCQQQKTPTPTHTHTPVNHLYNLKIKVFLDLYFPFSIRVVIQSLITSQQMILVSIHFKSPVYKFSFSHTHKIKMLANWSQIKVCRQFWSGERIPCDICVSWCIYVCNKRTSNQHIIKERGNNKHSHMKKSKVIQMSWKNKSNHKV